MISINRRLGRREGLISLIIPAVSYTCLAFAIILSMWPYFYYIKNETIISLGLFAMWRYGWMLLNYMRAIWFSLVHFPNLRRQVTALDEDKAFPEHIFFIIMSYNEEAWVSVESIQSIMSNLSDIPSRATLIIATGSEKDDRVISIAYQAHPAKEKVDLIIQRQHRGKRIAMGHALRAVARRSNDLIDVSPNSVTLFMDGDSFLPVNTLKKTLPFFCTFPKLGALTTNETAYINTKSRLYKDWFNLKFGMRHIMFQSHSLSHKVLTLTGRFSMMRTSICITESFITQIENDILTHWLHGKFRFLMGDDKSSWFHLLKNSWEMLYIPDVNVISLESRDGEFFSLSRTLPYRWYGNTLRNNARVLALGPKKIGWFIWMSILDQRLAMWTALVGIVGVSILSVTQSYVYLPFYIGWILLIRVIKITVIAASGHPVSMMTIPLMLYNQWVGAFIKIRAQYHLSDQKWAKGGKTQGGGGVITVSSRMQRWMPNYIMFLSVFLFAFVMLLNEGSLRLPDFDLYASEPTHPIFEARMYGIKANDGQDDAYALNKLVAWVPDESIVLLPKGQLDFFESLVIKRGNIQLKGVDGTEIISHIDTPGAAVIDVKGRILPKKFRLLADLKSDDQELNITSNSAHFNSGMLVQLEAPNDQVFLDSIHSKKWNREQPWIRQSIVRIEKKSGSKLTLSYMTGVAFPAAMTRLRIVEPVKNIILSDFTLRQDIPEHSISEVHLRFKNSFPKYAVDGIRLRYADSCLLKNLTILNAGRHPINLGNTYGCKLEKLNVSGAWNKGKKGNGYIRIARSYHNELIDSKITDIRHITLQWGASFNRLQDLTTTVDINFHGGYAHDNEVDNIQFTYQEGFKWKAITQIRDNAHWAPPDGPGNTVTNVNSFTSESQ